MTVDRGKTRQEEMPNVRPRFLLYVDVDQGGTAGASHQALYDLVLRLDRSRYQPVLRLEKDEDGKACFLAYLSEIGRGSRPQ